MGQLDNTYGVVFIGVLISAVLFGVTNLQVFIYFQRYSRDSIWDKLSVCLLWFLDAIHLALCGHLVYYYLVANYMNPLALFEIVWSFKAQIIIDAIVVVFVHTLYTIRLWKMTAVESQRTLVRMILPVFVSVVVFLGYGIAALLCYEIVQFELYTDLLQARWVTFMPLGTTTFIDSIIASSLCYLLARCRTGTEEMDSTITILMVYTLNTGVITILCSFTAMVTFAALPNTFTVLCIEFLVTKLYINSFMAMFNARNKLRSQVPTPDEPLTPHKHLSSGGSSSYTSTTLRFSSIAHHSALSADAYAFHYPVLAPDDTTSSPLSPLSLVSLQTPSDSLGFGSSYGIFEEKVRDDVKERGRHSPLMDVAPLSPSPAYQHGRRKPAPEMDADDRYTELPRFSRRVSRATVSELYEWWPENSTLRMENGSPRSSVGRSDDSVEELFFGVGIALTKD